MVDPTRRSENLIEGMFIVLPDGLSYDINIKIRKVLYET